MQMFAARRSRLTAVILLVVIAVTGLGVRSVVTGRMDARSARETLQALDLVASASDLVHQLQLERGTSSLYALEGQPVSADLVDRRLGTDAALRAFTDEVERSAAALDLSVQVAISDAMAGLDRLAVHRALVDDSAVGIDDSLDYYTRVITSLLDVGRIVVVMPDDTPRRLDVAAAFADVAHAKEAAGLERAVLADVVANRSFDSLTLPKVVDLVARQTGLLFDAQQSLPADLRAAFDTSLDTPEVTDAIAFRDRLLALEFGDSTPNDWFVVATARIDVLNEVQAELLDNVREVWDVRHGEADTGVTTWWWVMGVLVIAALGILARIGIGIKRHVVGVGLVAGIATSIALASFFQLTLVHDQELQRAQLAGDTVALVAERFDEYVDVTRALAQVVAANPELSQDEFTDAAEELLDPVYRPGVSDLNWLALVHPDEVDAFVAERRVTGTPDFGITPPTTEDAVVITYRYSSGGERAANLGFDVRSIPKARQAVDAAAATGSAVLTDVFATSDETGDGGAVIVYVPAYDDGVLIGFTNAVIMGRPFIEGIRGLSPDVAVELVDLDSDQRVPIASTHPDHVFAEDIPEHSLTMLGQTWGIRIESLEPLSPVQRWLPAVVFLAGLVSTVMLAITIAQVRGARIRAEELAAQRTTDLRRVSADLATLNDIGRAISATLDGDTVLDLIVQHAARLVDADACALFLVDHDARAITRRLAAGIDPMELDAHTYGELESGLSGFVWRTGVAARSQDVASDPRNTGIAAKRASGRTGVSIVVAPIVEAGRVVGTLSALSYESQRPMTDVDRNSIDLLAAQASVAIRNAEMYAHVVRVNEDLRIAQAARDEFVANISHEFRTPLTVIAGAAEILDEEDGLDEGDRTELTRRVRANAKRLEGMVQDVLLASRIEVGKAAPKPRVIELASKVGATIQDLGEIGRGVSNEVLPGLTVVADPDQLDRILFNLLSNAHKYGLPPVLVDAKRVGDVIELSVTDHGPGVDAALRERLFGRFEQGDSGPTRRSSGVGLGLHIVGELASLNGGDVRYDDSATGASFIVSLPASRALAVIA